jgi:Sec-independent protein translocase protein TatA
MGFGTEIFFFLALGLLVLGPKRLQIVIGHIARAKARFAETTQALKSQLSEELDDQQGENEPQCSSESS